jgi:hypothetical protein
VSDANAKDEDGGQSSSNQRRCQHQVRLGAEIGLLRWLSSLLREAEAGQQIWLGIKLTEKAVSTQQSAVSQTKTNPEFPLTHSNIQPRPCSR